MAIQQQRFRVVFTGEFDADRDLDRIKTDLMRRFKLAPPVLQRLLLGRPVVVKNNVDADTAYRYKAEIDKVGAVSRIEPVPVYNDVDEKGFVERRQGDRRIRAERRKTQRPGAIQPDRRKKDRRRNPR